MRKMLWIVLLVPCTTVAAPVQLNCTYHELPTPWTPRGRPMAVYTSPVVFDEQANTFQISEVMPDGSYRPSRLEVTITPGLITAKRPTDTITIDRLTGQYDASNPSLGHTYTGTCAPAGEKKF